MDMQTRNKRIIELAAAGWSYQRIASEVKLSKTATGNVIRAAAGVAPLPRPAAARKPAKARSFEDFRAKHDTTHIIAGKVKELLSGSEWFEDNDFRELCCVPSNNWRRHADSGEFDDYRVVKGSRINAWAPKAMARQMREVLDIHG